MKRLILIAVTALALAPVAPASAAAADACVGLPGPGPVNPEVCTQNGGSGRVCVDKYDPSTCTYWQ